jgi:hypothetical protein
MVRQDPRQRQAAAAAAGGLSSSGSGQLPTGHLASAAPSQSLIKGQIAATLLPLGLGTFSCAFSDAADGKSPLAAGADDGGASPAHVLAPPHPPMMRAHPSALPLSIRAVP